MNGSFDSSFTIYVLKLESGKYYVGRTKNLDKRYKDHLSNKGSSYTKKYAPLEIIEKYENMNPFEEDKIVLEYMYKYGIDNVRGGSYSMTNLSQIDIYNIKKKLWGAMDLCFICGRSHFSNRCNEEYDVYGDEIRKCKRCLRKGHMAYECFEDKNIFQKKILKNSEDFPKEQTIEEIENPKSCCTIL